MYQQSANIYAMLVSVEPPDHVIGNHSLSALLYAYTNIGKFNRRFCGPQVWNTIDESFKISFTVFFQAKLERFILDLH